MGSCGLACCLPLGRSPACCSCEAAALDCSASAGRLRSTAWPAVACQWLCRRPGIGHIRCCQAAPLLEQGRLPRCRAAGPVSADMQYAAALLGQGRLPRCRAVGAAGAALLRPCQGRVVLCPWLVQAFKAGIAAAPPDTLLPALLVCRLRLLQLCCTPSCQPVRQSGQRQMWYSSGTGYAECCNGHGQTAF